MTVKKLRVNTEIVIFAVLLLAIFATVLCPNNEYVKRISANSTTLLTFLTAAYVVLTFLLLRSTRASIEEQHRPYVVASLPVDKFLVFCRIENTGDRPAYSVSVTFSPNLDAISGDHRFKGMAEPLLFQSFLPPHFSVQNTISSTIHALSVPQENKKFAVTVAYEDSKGKQFKDSYTIDVNGYLYEKKMVGKDLVDHVEEPIGSLSDPENGGQRGRHLLAGKGIARNQLPVCISRRVVAGNAQHGERQDPNEMLHRRQRLPKNSTPRDCQ